MITFAAELKCDWCKAKSRGTVSEDGEILKPKGWVKESDYRRALAVVVLCPSCEKQYAVEHLPSRGNRNKASAFIRQHGLIETVYGVASKIAALAGETSFELKGDRLVLTAEIDRLEDSEAEKQVRALEKRINPEKRKHIALAVESRRLRGIWDQKEARVGLKRE